MNEKYSILNLYLSPFQKFKKTHTDTNNKNKETDVKPSILGIKFI